MYFQSSFNQGKISEQLFEIIAKKRSWNVVKSSSIEDRTNHWDFLIQKSINCIDDIFEKDNEEYKGLKVDVKSLKRISRTDSTVENDWIWIELHSSNKNREGWLYNSKADILAFETINSFILINREEVINIVKKYLINEVVKSGKKHIIKSILEKNLINLH